MKSPLAPASSSRSRPCPLGRGPARLSSPRNPPAFSDRTPDPPGARPAPPVPDLKPSPPGPTPCAWHSLPAPRSAYPTGPVGCIGRCRPCGRALEGEADSDPSADPSPHPPPRQPVGPLSHTNTIEYLPPLTRRAPFRCCSPRSPPRGSRGVGTTAVLLCSSNHGPAASPVKAPRAPA